MFGGRLSSHEIAESEKETSAKTLKPGLKVSEVGVSADFQTNKESGSASKRVIDPHDLITTDVLSALMDSHNLIREDIEEAPHCALILALGTLVFVDHSIVELGIVALEASLKDQRRNAGTKAAKDEVKAMDMGLPSTFRFSPADQQRYPGSWNAQRTRNGGTDSGVLRETRDGRTFGRVPDWHQGNSDGSSHIRRGALDGSRTGCCSVLEVRYVPGGCNAGDPDCFVPQALVNIRVLRCPHGYSARSRPDACSVIEHRLAGGVRSKGARPYASPRRPNAGGLYASVPAFRLGSGITLRDLGHVTTEFLGRSGGVRESNVAADHSGQLTLSECGSD
jgi:hypothetical protein